MGPLFLFARRAGVTEGRCGALPAERPGRPGRPCAPVPVQAPVLLAGRRDADVFLHVVQHLQAPQAVVDLGGGVLPGAQGVKAEIVLGVGLERFFNGVFRHVRGDEQHAAGRAEHDVARQAHRLVDAAGGVDTHRNAFPDGRGVHSPVEHLGVLDLFHLFDVPHTAPDDRTAGAGAGGDGRGEVAAHEGAVVDLVEHVGHHHVAFHQIVHHPLVAGAGIAQAAALLLHIAGQVRPCGNKGAGDGAPHQLFAGVQGLHVPRVLKLVPCYVKRQPDLLQRHSPQGVQDRIGHSGPAVLKAFPFPLRGQLQNALFVVVFHVFPPELNFETPPVPPVT